MLLSLWDILYNRRLYLPVLICCFIFCAITACVEGRTRTIDGKYKVSAYPGNVNPDLYLTPAEPAYSPTPAPVTHDCRPSDDRADEVCEVKLGDVRIGRYDMEYLTFNPSQISFELGQTGKIKLVNISETESHSFTVDGLDIDEVLEPGETKQIEVFFDARGSFGLKCKFHTEETGIIVAW